MNSTEQPKQDTVAAIAESRIIVSRKEAISKGVNRYFTGIKCKNGHIEDRVVSTRTCLECKRYKDRNPSVKRVEYVKKYNRTDIAKSKSADYQKRPDVAERRRKKELNNYWNDVELSREKAMDKYRNNKESILKHTSRRRKERRKSCKIFKSIEMIRNMVARIIRLSGDKKNSSSELLSGYSREDLSSHIERQFVGEMSWSNWGKVWEVDHIIPVAYFFSVGEIDPKVINALSNLKPIKKSENRSKGCKIINLI